MRHVTSIIKALRGPLFMLTWVASTGCESLPEESPASHSYSNISAANFNYQQYYLSLKSMNNDALQLEAERLKSHSDNTINQIKLALVFCVPNSMNHNPYSAKTLLNKLNNSKPDTIFNQNNQGFFTLLNDLLNQQLLGFNKYDKKTKGQAKTITELAKQVELLQKQIDQLKQIETSLNKHG